MCKGCFDIALNHDIRVLHNILNRKMQQILQSRCTCQCTLMQNLLLEVYFFSALYRLLKYNEINAPIEKSYKELMNFNQDTVDQMLLENEDPGLLFETDNGALISFSEQPCEALRVHAKDVLEQSKVFQDFRSGAYETFSEKSKYYVTEIAV